VMAEDSSDQGYKPGRSGRKRCPGRCRPKAPCFLGRNQMARGRIQAAQSKGANKRSKLGSAASQWTCILERIQERSFGSRQQSRDRNQREGTNSADKAGALLCKSMHTVARIITIDKQSRSITVVSNWGERYAQGQGAQRCRT
jgi:hypothetical protein